MSSNELRELSDYHALMFFCEEQLHQPGGKIGAATTPPKRSLAYECIRTAFIGEVPDPH